MRIFAQARKEITQFRRDRLTVALGYVLPIAALLLYGLATRLESKNIPVAVFNLDNGKLSREFIGTLFANGQVIPASWPQRSRDVMAPLDLGVAKASIVIPPEFSRMVQARRGAPIQVIIDATDVNNARVIKNGILATTNFFLANQGLKRNPGFITTRIRLWFNPGRKESLYIAPGALAVFLWIFPCMLSCLCIAREKEEGTMLQLYASSMTSVEMIAGKALAYLLIAYTQSVVMILCSMLVFGLQFVGSIPMFLVCLSMYLLCSVCFGLFVGSRASTQTAGVQMVAIPGFTSALLLSGFLYPLRNINWPLSLFSNIIPARYFVEGTRDFFVRGTGFFGQLHILLWLAGLTFLYFFVSTKITKRMQLSD